jgi:tetraacyldisaccharide 4'-kinase
MLKILGSTWGTVARVRASLYERGWLPRYRLERPVISIGGLSVGGAGKTPTTALIAALLCEAGFRPAILSRGYRRSGSEPLLVSAGDGNKPRVDAARAGDEPCWLAHVLPGVAVAVAAKREQAARLALSAGDRDLFLLDDGFQHLRLARDVNLLVVNPEAPFWDDAPMPTGRLRERPDAARRADAFLIVGADDDVRDTLDERFGARPRFALLRQPATWWPLHQPAPEVSSVASVENPEQAAGAPDQPAFAFAGIARPARFFEELQASGVEVTGTRAFADHQAFSPATLRAVAETARLAGATMLLTTEKDAVRMPDELPDMPICVWGYRLSARQPQRLVAWLKERAGLSTWSDAA